MNNAQPPKNFRPIVRYEKPISRNEITVFTRQLSTLIAAGIALVPAITAITTEQDNPTLKTVLTSLTQTMMDGHSFAHSLRQHPRLFDALFCNSIHAAEVSGTLAMMLGRLAHHLEKSALLNNKIRKALTYPLAILLLTIMVTMILMLVIVPEFQQLFATFNAELPALTRFIIHFANHCKHAIGGYFLLLCSLIYTLKILKKNSIRFNLWLDQLSLNTFFWGPFIKKVIIARVSRTLSTLLTAGTPLVEALIAVAATANNAVFKNALLAISQALTTGETLHQAIKHTGVFPSMVTQLIAAGEHCGALDIMLDKVANYYDSEIDHAVNSLSELIEPVVMLLLGALVGTVVLALYLPLFKLGAVF